MVLMWGTSRGLKGNLKKKKRILWVVGGVGGGGITGRYTPFFEGGGRKLGSGFGEGRKKGSTEEGRDLYNTLYYVSAIKKIQGQIRQESAPVSGSNAQKVALSRRVKALGTADSKRRPCGEGEREISRH